MSARRRFVAPPRAAQAPVTFAHPRFAALAAHRDLLEGADWPALALLDARLGGRRHPHTGVPLAFVAQTPALLADGEHYETRIARRGAIATREHSWHDLFNALAWLAHGGIKAALNLRQVQEIGRVGPRRRSRAQCALTHFDEAGAIVTLRDAALLAAWDRHDWRALFVDAASAWRDGGIAIEVFGHALLEHALAPGWGGVAKCVVVRGDAARPDALAGVVDGIASGRLLNDPQELRPLPLGGIPGWDPRNADVGFYGEAPCFRPLRPGRCYPPPLPVAGATQSSIGPS